MKKRATSVGKKSSTQVETASTRSGSKSKSRRAVSQTQKIAEEFDEQLLNIDITKPRRPFNFFISDMFKKEEDAKIDSETMKAFSKKFKGLSEKEKDKYK